MSATRQDVLKVQAIGKLNDGGMGALWRWYSGLPEADRVLLDDFIVKPGSIPVDVEPEGEAVEVEETKPKATKAMKAYTCKQCGATWLVPMAWCAECGNGFEEAA